MKIIQKDRDGLQCFIGLDRPSLSQPSNGELRIKTYKSQKFAWEDLRKKYFESN